MLLGLHFYKAHQRWYSEFATYINVDIFSWNCSKVTYFKQMIYMRHLSYPACIFLVQIYWSDLALLFWWWVRNLPMCHIHYKALFWVSRQNSQIREEHWIQERQVWRGNDGDFTCNDDLGIIGLHVPVILSCSLSLPLLLGFLRIKRICVVFQDNQLCETKTKRYSDITFTWRQPRREGGREGGGLILCVSV